MERDLQIKRRSADATEEVNGDDDANDAGAQTVEKCKLAHSQ